MKIILTLLLAFITSLAYGQESVLNLGTNLVILCGAQDVFSKNSVREEYEKTYTWPEGTYTLFEIKSEEKIFSYRTVSASLVQNALNEHTESKDILNALLSENTNDIEFTYEILEEVEPVKGLNQEFISAMIYVLKLDWEDKEDVNTTAQLMEGNVSISSIDMDEKPYKSVYPVLHFEVFAYGY